MDWIALLQVDTPQVLEVALLLALLVFSLSVHEVAHAVVALRCGDTTARDLGRITLNPIAHIDLFMSILLPAMLWFTAGFIFGGAKPVPVNYFRLRYPLRDMALVAIAGPLSNVLLAFPFFLAFKIAVDVVGLPESHSLARVLLHTSLLNLFLAVFNLLPVPPLDGSRVMAWLMPKSLRDGYVRLESFGIVIVIALLYVFPQTMRMLQESVLALLRVVERVVSLGGAW
jgi:Zn-dependent protease